MNTINFQRKYLALLFAITVLFSYSSNLALAKSSKENGVAGTCGMYEGSKMITCTEVAGLPAIAQKEACLNANKKMKEKLKSQGKSKSQKMYINKWAAGKNCDLTGAGFRCDFGSEAKASFRTSIIYYKNANFSQEKIAPHKRDCVGFSGKWTKI